MKIVVSWLGLNSIGQLNSLTVDYLYFNDNTINYQNPSLANGDVVLVPKGSGSVSVSNKKITNLATPIDGTDAVNLETLVYSVQTAPLGLSINVGSLTNPQIALNIITKIYPPAEHQDGAICRIWCIDLSSAKQFTLSSGVWGSGIDI